MLLDVVFNLKWHICLLQIFGGLIILLALLAQFFTSTGADHVSPNTWFYWSLKQHQCKPLVCPLCLQFENRAPSLILLYVVGGITMLIAVLGAYGANKEKRGALIAVSNQNEIHNKWAHI